MEQKQRPGPVDITLPGQESLVAELGATPGKRIDCCLDRMKTEQLYKVSRLTPRIRGPYRQQLLSRKLAFMMPERGVAPPRSVFLRVRRTAPWAKKIVGVIARSILKPISDQYPEQARMAAEFTKIIDGRTPRVSEAWINEEAMTDSFNLDEFEAHMKDPWLDHERLTEKIEANWDVPAPPSRRTMYDELWTSLKGWAFALRLPLSHRVRTAAQNQLWHDLREVPAAAESTGPEDNLEMDRELVATARLDKNERPLIRRGKRLHHEALY